MSRIVFNLIFAVVVFVMSNAASADEMVAPAGVCEAHPVVYHRSQPHIERVPVKVVDPVDVAISKSGDTYVADHVGRVVLKVDAWGETSLVGDDLVGISRISRSAFGTYVLLARRGSGDIVRLTNNGFRSSTQLPFRPAGLSVQSDGAIYTSNEETGELFRLTIDGELERVTSVSEPTRDIATSDIGTVYLLLQSGKVVAVFPDGETKEVAGYLPHATTRIAIDPNSQAIVGLANGADEKSALYRATEKRTVTDRFASVVRGTSAFAFDKLGNLTLASPDLRAITQVKTHFRIPCPACGELFPLVFSPNAPVRGQEDTESF